VAETANIDPRIHAIAGGLHLVVAQDDVIEKVTRSLRERQVEYVAPGHCTGEPTFAALQKAFGERYLFAGLGSTLSVGEVVSSRQALPVRGAQDDDGLATYRRLAVRERHWSETMIAAGIELRGWRR
jgi:7,8-dihydropterin-6-yl-methyl-4-(beta-D-ribofuranosyl)aminobenzene 5'-phosphate synthase